MDQSSKAVLHAELRERRKNLSAAISKVGRENHLVDLLREVDTALERISDGSYGLCETCREPIEEDRLVVNPLIRNCLDHLTAAEQRVLEHDLDLAYQVQTALLPRQGFVSRSWEVAHYYDPAGSVSGDYIDVLVLDGEHDRFLFLLGDVTGKGVAASILMSSLHAIFRTLTKTPLPMPVLMEQANRLFCEGTTSRYFATIASGLVEDDGSVEIVAGGHPAPLVMSRSGVFPVEATGVALGMFCSMTYTSKRIVTEPGDTIFLYSDGLTEARDRSEREYGVERLREVIANVKGESPQRVIETVVQDLKTFRGSTPKLDDVSLMALKRHSVGRSA